MRLCDLYKLLDKNGRQKLADTANVDVGYLWQIATSWRGKKPSVDVINRLCRADRRLKPADLVVEFSQQEPGLKETPHA